MTVPTVNPVSRRHLRQRKTSGRLRSGRLFRRLTMGANKPVAPASLLQVGGEAASSGKSPGTLGAIVETEDCHAGERPWHGRTLPLVAVGDNRIGKGSCSP